MSREDRAVSESSLAQAEQLIDQVLEGADAETLIDATSKFIKEGQGPFDMGIKVKINQSWSGTDHRGKPISFTEGDTVWVSNTVAGNFGHSRVVTPDGVARAVVPLKILGEQIEESTPKGHIVPSATGSRMAKAGRVLGAPWPHTVAHLRVSGPATAISGTPQGRGLPTVNSPGLSEDDLDKIKSHEILTALEMLRSNENTSEIDEIKSRVEEFDDSRTIHLAHQMMFDGAKELTVESFDTFVDDLESMDEDELAEKAAPFFEKKKDKKDKKEESDITEEQYKSSVQKIFG